MSQSTAALRDEARLVDEPDDEWDALTDALHRWGVLHVAPVNVPAHQSPIPSAELFERLWRSDDARLHQATVFLLLTNPHLAIDARRAIGRLAGRQRDRAMRRYAAATALQRMARSRIAADIGERGEIPPTFLDELGLPNLDGEFGRVTLLALAEQESATYGYDAWGTYRAPLDLFLNEIKRVGWGTPCASEPIEPV